MKTKKILPALLLAAFPAFGLAADAAGTPGASGQFATLREVAQKAVLNNPEVMARWHNSKAAVEEVGVARGGYLPRVNLTVAVSGREYLKEPASNFNSRVTGAPVAASSMATTTATADC